MLYGIKISQTHNYYTVNKPLQIPCLLSSLCEMEYRPLYDTFAHILCFIYEFSGIAPDSDRFAHITLWAWEAS